MSLNEILQQNSKELFAHSLTLITPTIQPSIGFRYDLLGTSPINVPSGNTPTYITNYSDGIFDPDAYRSPSFNNVTGIFTVPLSGYWHFDAGVFTTFIPVGGIDTTLECGISLPSDVGSAICYSSQFIKDTFTRNWSSTVSTNIYVLQGTQLQLFVLQNSTRTLVLPAVNYNFFSGFLLGTSSSSPL